MVEIKLYGKKASEHLGFTFEDLADIDTLAESNEYWNECCLFVSRLFDMDAKELTNKQIHWANVIKDKLEDLRRKDKL